MDRISHRASLAGLTLIELMIVLGVLVVLLQLAVPSMQSLLHGNRIRVEAHRLLGAINLARSEAVLRNSPVSLCPSRMSETGVAVCDGTYADGWLVFSNSNRDRVVDSGVDEVLQVFPPLPTGYTLTNRDGSRLERGIISYLPDGSSRVNRTLLICAPPGIDAEPLGVVVNNVGRPRLARGWGTCSHG